MAHHVWSLEEMRNLRRWRQLLLGVLATRSTRLLRLAQAVLPERQARRVTTAALGLGYVLARADVRGAQLSRDLLLAVVRALPPGRLVGYRGAVLLVMDPTARADQVGAGMGIGRPSPVM